MWPHVNVDYEDLDGYQRALLALVGLTGYTDEVVDRLSKLMDEVKDVAEIDSAVRMLRAFSGMEDAWLLLFSFQNLAMTCKAVDEWQRTGVCPQLGPK